MVRPEATRSNGWSSGNRRLEPGWAKASQRGEDRRRLLRGAFMGAARRDGSEPPVSEVRWTVQGILIRLLDRLADGRQLRHAALTLRRNRQAESPHRRCSNDTTRRKPACRHARSAPYSCRSGVLHLTPAHHGLRRKRASRLAAPHEAASALFGSTPSVHKLTASCHRVGERLTLALDLVSVQELDIRVHMSDQSVRERRLARTVGPSNDDRVRLCHANLPFRWPGTTRLAAAVVRRVTYTTSRRWNAYTPATKKITVATPNTSHALPASFSSSITSAGFQ